ncbi:MAG: hypothetical protein PHH49_08425 [Candidatus Omnitrophica bacterium]|nr:hypothetical protein [Candidatus Omnitrophota bacterium]MDD5488963.1 hypothetical protein [Candidatus Omnitrophota bacterium]
MSHAEERLMRESAFRKEFMTLKRKFSIPKRGSDLEQMKSTKEGMARYERRKEKWDEFKKKWNVVFMIGDKPVFKKKKSRKKTDPKGKGKK